MCKTSSVFRQFLTIICCNLLTISFGSTIGWATINFVELQSKNSTFPMGPFTLDQLALVMSIHNVGCFLGNFAIAPLSNVIGIKLAIHSFGSLFIVSEMCETLVNYNLKFNYFVILAVSNSGYFCTERILYHFVQIAGRICNRCFGCWHSNSNK